MMRRAVPILVLSLALIAISGAAQALQLTTSADSLTVRTGESSTIDLTVLSTIDDIFVVSVLGEQPWMSIPVHIQTKASIPTRTSLTFSPYITTQPSIYKLELGLFSPLTGDNLRKNLTVIVRVAEVAVENIEVTGNLQPTGFGEVEVFVKNYEQVPADVVLEIKAGPGDLLSSRDTISLNVREFEAVKKSFGIPECRPAGDYFVTAELFSKGTKIFSAVNNFTIPTKFIPKVVRNITQAGLRSEFEITVSNIGNLAGIAEVSESILGSLFFSGSQPTRIEGGTYKWLLSIDPCQSRAIRFQIDYTPIAVVIFAIIALWYVFFRMRTVRITKKILQKAIIEKGMEFTVGVDIKTYVKLKDIEIHDFVPAIFEVRDTPGIKPIRRRTSAGTELIWRFAELPSREERVLDYKIIPLFSVSGVIKLPAATATFTHLGRRIDRNSAQASLGMQIIKRVEHAETAFADILKKLRSGLKKPQKTEE
jgi:hypothetical protein